MCALLQLREQRARFIVAAELDECAPELGHWPRAAEEAKAELPKLEGGTCHPYRRKWKSERANHPVKAVAVAGGWTDIATMLRCYDQPDDADVLAVTSDPRKRRDAVAAT